MNKNPFAVPQPYTPQQPPLPPGPPPPHPAQPDYSAYWAAAAAAQQAQQSGVAAAYNPQWPAAQPAQPARPTPEQSALYANYGYGGQQNLAWQQQQRQAQQHYQPPPPVVQPPPPPPQPAYNPYQPQAGAYQQPYVPQASPPQPIPQPAYQPPIPAPQTFQQPQQPFFQQQQQQNRPQNRNHSLHQTPPQHPAKRPRFEHQNQNRNVPPQPQFQPPPAPPTQSGQSGPVGGGVGIGVGYSQGPSQNHGPGRGGGPGVNQVPLGGGRGGFGGGRGGNPGGRGRGSPMGMNRGGNRGRGMYNNMGPRGGGPNQSGSFRGHGANRGFGNRDNRRGGSFNAGGGQGFSHGHQQQQQQHHHQQNFSGSSSFRGRNQGYNNSTRGSRHDSGSAHTARDGPSAAGFSSSKKEENRRTLTDFKIVGLEIQDLGWSWGALPRDSTASEMKKETVDVQLLSTDVSDDQSSEQKDAAEPTVTAGSSTSLDTLSAPAAQTFTMGDGVTVKSEAVTDMPPPPSRIRIYFHTPVTADDAHPVTPQSSFSLGPSSESTVRRGKRKKLDDDDGDEEDGRGPPPPPPGADHDNASVAASVDFDCSETLAGRDSVAPSVEETASEGDWLMAAIGEDEAEAEGGDENHLHVTEVENLHDEDPDAIGEDYVEGEDYDAIHEELHMGADNDQAHTEGGHIKGVGNAIPVSNEPRDNHLDHEAPVFNGANSSFDAPHVVASASESSGPNGPPNGTTVSTQTTSVVPHPDSPNSHAVLQSAANSLSAAPEAGSATEDNVQNGELGTDHHTQASAPSHVGAPLRATDSMVTVLDSNEDDNVSPYASTVLNEDDHTAMGGLETFEVTEPEDHPMTSDEHPHEQTAVAATTASIPGPVVEDVSTSQSAAKAESKPDRTPSANRLSISYAAGTRRMVIDAEIVDKLKVYRGEARIEVHMNINKDDGHFKGIVVEAFSDATTSYTPLDIIEGVQDDVTVPPFNQAIMPSTAILLVHLDKDRPLSEPKWVKTGDVQEWLKSMFGRMFWVAGDAADGWEKKIEVVDPDPPPTIWTVLEAWAMNSNVGVQIERQRFLRTHMTETDNILEILLRLVRGERASYSQSAPAISGPSLSGPLLSALSQGSAHAAQQTHVSLAVLAIFRLAVEFAKKAVGDAGKGEAEARVGEIIRCLPSHLIYKSLDGIFKEWRVEKKGGR